jgi:glycine C-acetyltransferase
MDGDMSKLAQIYKVAKDYDAITIVDDAHGDFILGRNFAGTPDAHGIPVDIHISSMSKGLGCFGGYVATTQQIRELLINTSRPFIYTSAIPAHLCSSAIAAIPIAKRGHLQKKLFENITYFSKGLRELGFKIDGSISHIIPILIGDEKKTVEFSSRLLTAGVFVQAIRYPTVPKGSARLRVSLTASHNHNHLDKVINAFSSIDTVMRIT